jgi:hypothetical protein
VWTRVGLIGIKGLREAIYDLFTLAHGRQLCITPKAHPEPAPVQGVRAAGLQVYCVTGGAGCLLRSPIFHGDLA